MPFCGIPALQAADEVSSAATSSNTTPGTIGAALPTRPGIGRDRGEEPHDGRSHRRRRARGPDPGGRTGTLRHRRAPDRPGPHATETSKALVVWSRTLELMDRMGCTGAFLAAGLRARGASIRSGENTPRLSALRGHRECLRLRPDDSAAGHRAPARGASAILRRRGRAAGGTGRLRPEGGRRRGAPAPRRRSRGAGEDAVADRLRRGPQRGAARARPGVRGGGTGRRLAARRYAPRRAGGAAAGRDRDLPAPRRPLRGLPDPGRGAPGSSPPWARRMRRIRAPIPPSPTCKPSSTGGPAAAFAPPIRSG